MSDSDPFADRSSDCPESVSEPSSFECSEYPRCDWGSSCVGNHSFSHYPDSSVEELDEKSMRVKGDEVVDKAPCATFEAEKSSDVGRPAKKSDDGGQAGAEKSDDNNGCVDAKNSDDDGFHVQNLNNEDEESESESCN